MREKQERFFLLYFIFWLAQQSVVWGSNGKFSKKKQRKSQTWLYMYLRALKKNDEVDDEINSKNIKSEDALM